MLPNLSPRRRALGAALLLATLGASAQQETVRVTAETVRVTDTPSRITLTGSVTAERDAQLSPRVEGLVSELLVDAGDRVEAGDVLLRQDAELAGLALRRAQAARDEQRTRLAEAERLRDEREVLARDGRIPASTYKSQQAEARLAGAALQRLDAEVAEAEARLCRHALIAPFDGVISRRHVDAGEWLTTGATAFDLIAIDRVRIDVQVPQIHIDALAVGAPAEIRLDAAPETPLQGEVVAMVPVGDVQARTFLTRIEARANAVPVLPGLSARVILPVGDAEPRLSVPRDALLRFPDGSAVVWILEKDDDGVLRGRRQPVQLGAARGDRVVIRDGLAEGDRVVVRGNERLRENQPVQVVDDDDG